MLTDDDCRPDHVDAEMHRRVVDALRPSMLPGERVLAVARLRDTTSPWDQFVVMAQHRFARVALLDGAEPAVVEIPYAEVVSSSWLPVEFWTVDGSRVDFGRLADECDASMLEDQMWDLALPTTHGGLDGV